MSQVDSKVVLADSAKAILFCSICCAPQSIPPQLFLGRHVNGPEPHMQTSFKLGGSLGSPIGCLLLGRWVRRDSTRRCSTVFSSASVLTVALRTHSRRTLAKPCLRKGRWWAGASYRTIVMVGLDLNHITWQEKITPGVARESWTCAAGPGNHFQFLFGMPSRAGCDKRRLKDKRNF